MLLRRQAVLIALAAVVRRHHIAGEALVDMLIKSAAHASGASMAALAPGAGAGARPTALSSHKCKFLSIISCVCYSIRQASKRTVGCAHRSEYPAQGSGGLLCGDSVSAVQSGAWAEVRKVGGRCTPSRPTARPSCCARSWSAHTPARSELPHNLRTKKPQLDIDNLPASAQKQPAG